jgi:hypothetical protein
MANVPPGAQDRARALFGDLIAGRWEQAREEFRGHLDADRIAHAWAHAPGPPGGFENVGEPSARQVGEYTLVELPLTSAAGEGIGRIALDQDGKVAGLTMQYPRRHRLDPRPVRIFVHGPPGITDLLTPGRPRRAHRPARSVSSP